MKYTILFFAVLLLLTINTYDKKVVAQTGQPVPMGTTARIKTERITDTNFGVKISYTFTYDASNRIKSYSYGSGYRNYQYYADSVLEQAYDSSGDFLEKKIYLLNAKGLADSSYSVVGLGSASASTDKYFYDTNGYLIKSKTYYPDVDDDQDVDLAGVYHLEGTSNSKIVNGNLVLVKNNSTDIVRDSCTYIPNSVNTIDQINRGFLFLGASSINLVLTWVTIDKQNLSVIDTHKYVFDNSNRVVADTTISTVKGEVRDKTVNTFTYY